VTEDLRPLHRSALRAADRLVGRVAADDLDNPTPCGSWTLDELLAHMVGQHLGFAAAVRDGDAPRTAYAPAPFSPASWRQSTTALLAAFDAADPGARVVAGELSPAPLPLAFVVGAQLLDTVVHTWDVAQALGTRHEPSPDLVAAVAQLAPFVPDDESREAPGAAFARALPGDGTPWERTLAHLGRDPARQPFRPAGGTANRTATA
jgi:uncharacterized protein (TIGR03086 family)